SETHSVFPRGRADGEPPLPANPYLRTALIGSFVAQGLTLIVPGLRNLLGLAPISLVDGLVIGGSALLPFVGNERTKPMAVVNRDRQGVESLPLAHALGSRPLPA